MPLTVIGHAKRQDWKTSYRDPGSYVVLTSVDPEIGDLHRGPRVLLCRQPILVFECITLIREEANDALRWNLGASQYLEQ